MNIASGKGRQDGLVVVVLVVQPKGRQFESHALPVDHLGMTVACHFAPLLCQKGNPPKEQTKAVQ